MKILFIAGHEFLHNPQNGGQRCSLNNYNLIKKVFGQENTFLCLFSNYTYNNLDKNTKVFSAHKNKFELLLNTISFRNVCNKKTFIEVLEYIKKLEVDIIFADSSTIGYLSSKIKNKVIVTFFHNIEKNYAKNKLIHEGIIYLPAYISYCFNEKKAAKISDKLIFLNNRDSTIAKKIYGRDADFILPITFEDKCCNTMKKEKFNKKLQLLFVGSLFQPNVEGIKWFVQKVMPNLSNHFTLIIVGKGMETLKQQLESKNVHVVGTVDKLDEVYYDSDAIVIPIFYGDGMKVKTAEAMMYGKPIFSSKEGLEGYDISGVEGIYECNTSEKFIEEIEKRCTMETITKAQYSVRECFLKNYEANIMSQKLEKFFLEQLKKSKNEENMI